MNQKILFIGNFLSKSGNPTYEELLAKKLEESTHIGIIRTSSWRWRILRLLDMLSTIISKSRQYKMAHISLFSGKAFVWAELCAGLLKRLNKKIIMTLHGGNLPNFSQDNAKRVKKVLNMAESVIAPSGYLKELMRPFCAREIEVIPNAIDITKYPFINRSEPKPKLIWLRAFHEIYHPAIAVEAVHILCNDFPKIHLMMIGPDKGDGALQKVKLLIKERRLEPHITIIEGVPKEKVPQYLNQADIFLNTTNIDNTPVSVIEAMACGLCIVSTNVGGVPYLIEREKNGLLVEPNEAHKMASAIKKIIADYKLAETISLGARKTVEEFDWSNVLPKWEDLFESLS